MRPSVNQVHVNTLLSDFSIAYGQSLDSFIATKMFPVHPVLKESDNILEWSRDAWHSIAAEILADGDEPLARDLKISTDGSYVLKNYSLATRITDRQRQNSDNPISVEKKKMKWLTEQIYKKLEKVFADSYMQLGVWTTDVAAGGLSGRWNVGTSDPIGDITSQKDIVRQLTGKTKFALGLGSPVMSALLTHPDLVERVQYTSVPTNESLRKSMASLLGVDYVFVSGAIYNANAVGLAFSGQNIIDDDALLIGYTEDPGQEDVVGGVTFGKKNQFIVTKMTREAKREADFYWNTCMADMKLICADCGVFFSDIV
jgi:hypothetical protein